jgi:hypothetical protein
LLHRHLLACLCTCTNVILVPHRQDNLVQCSVWRKRWWSIQ